MPNPAGIWVNDKVTYSYDRQPGGIYTIILSKLERKSTDKRDLWMTLVEWYKIDPLEPFIYLLGMTIITISRYLQRKVEICGL